MNMFKFKTKIRRFLISFLKINRQTSYPFITGDGYRAFAQHVLDELSDIQPERIEKNDIVFVRNDFLHDFFKQKHTLINHKYILISSNDDTNVTEKYANYIDEKIIHWFTSALDFKHEKLSSIPIGLTNYHYSYSGRGNLSFLFENIDDAKIKANRICFGFAAAPSAIDRIKLMNLLKKNSFADNIETKKQSDYYKKMSDYKFIISPDGRAIDSHRTWEALYLKVIPIVKKSILAESFKNLGMPILIVNEWNELENFDEHFLSTKYDEMKKGFDNPTIYMDYWINHITNKRTK